jgi:XTP/dITP diphosphohydrolase
MSSIVRSTTNPHPVRLMFASQNVVKHRELALAFEVAQFPVQCLVPPAHWDVEETGLTFAENAHRKAASLLEWLQTTEGLSGVDAILADDSGYEIEARSPNLVYTPELPTFPGVWSNRWLTADGWALLGASLPKDEASEWSPFDGSLQQKCEAILHLMQGETQRRAQFVCHLCLLMPDTQGLWHATTFHGVMPLWVTEASVADFRAGRCGDGGFGYDPINHPRHADGTIDPRTVAQLDPTEKHALSHRGQALRQLIQHLIVK